MLITTRDPQTVQGGDRAAFINALFSGGDSRIAADPRTGLNKYFCPATPVQDGTWLASCTASPIWGLGFERAFEAWSQIARGANRTDRLMALTDRIETRLLAYFEVSAIARIVLCPSGTDALLTAAMLVGSERPHVAMTAILPAASETGTGVPLAAVGRMFDGPDSGRLVTGQPGTTIEVPLRAPDGSPFSDAALNDAFAAAEAGARGNVVVYLTHSSKTGLIAPVTPPPGANVIVDACQGRIAPATVARYLRRGWPVVVTGSKFFGGPAFSGAVLLPWDRFAPTSPKTVEPGTALRWTAALAVIDAFEPLADGVAHAICRQGAAIELAIAANPALVPMGGMRAHGPGWAEQPSIFTFGVRDAKDRRRMLSMAELRPLYERLARAGALFGQPVELGICGGLRVAIGARDLLGAEGVPAVPDRDSVSDLVGVPDLMGLPDPRGAGIPRADPARADRDAAGDSGPHRAFAALERALAA